MLSQILLMSLSSLNHHQFLETSVQDKIFTHGPKVSQWQKHCSNAGIKLEPVSIFQISLSPQCQLTVCYKVQCHQK